MTEDIVAFIQARMAEDERIARDAETMASEYAAYTTALPDQVANQASRQGPRRALRAVEVKRRVLDLHVTAGLDVILAGDDELEVAAATARKSALNDVVRAMAGEWNTHRDYRQEWAL